MRHPQISEQTTTAFRLEDVSFSYPRMGIDATRPPLFQGLQVGIDAGQMLGVIGPNGSGKTTFLKLLAGIVRPLGGTIHLQGQDVSTFSPHEVGRRVAYVPQEFHVTFPFTVQEIVLMGRYPHRRTGLWHLWGWETREDYLAADWAMRRLNVLSLAEKPITAVSGGERQRALIARALAQDAAILLLDEPTAFLDLSYQLDICRVLRALTVERGLTIVMVSHDLNLASQYCDRLLLLDRGLIMAMDDPGSVLRPELLEPIYGCRVLIDRHPESGLPRISLPGRTMP